MVESLLLPLALEAGTRIMKIYRSGFSVSEKEDASPVTEADRVSDEIIRKGLSVTGIPVISEEFTTASYEDRKNWDKVWIVDPLDGTKEFVKKTGEFTVNIALVEAGKPVEGLIFAPAIGLAYFTHGTNTVLKINYEEDKSGDFILRDKTILTGENTSTDICASISHSNDDTRNFIESYLMQHPDAHLKSVGSSLKFCWLAEGLAAVYPRFSPTMEWDTAAGQAILERVGGKVLDWETQTTLTYNRSNLRNGNFVALAAEFSL